MPPASTASRSIRRSSRSAFSTASRWSAGPGSLRVHLFTRRHDRRAPRSRIAIASGDATSPATRRRSSGGRHRASGSRSRRDYLSSPTASGTSSRYSNTQVWLQGGYVPSAEVRPAVPARPVRPRIAGRSSSDAVVSDDTSGLGFDATRTDAQLRLALRSRPDGLGPDGGSDLRADRAGTGPASSSGSTRSAARLPSHARSLSLGGSALLPLAVDAARRSAATSAGRRRRQLSAQRRGGLPAPRRATGTAGAWRSRPASQPVRGLGAHRHARGSGEQVVAPVDRRRHRAGARDLRRHGRLGARAARARGRLGAHRRVQRRSATAEFLRIPSLGADRRRGLADGAARGSRRSAGSRSRAGTATRARAPARRHSADPLARRAARSARSSCGTFPSGAFDLKLRFSLESWGRGVIGRDGRGAPITLTGATFFRSLVQFQIAELLVLLGPGKPDGDRARRTSRGSEMPAYGTHVRGAVGVPKLDEV